MKHLAFIVFVIMTFPCFSQSKVEVEYRGGINALAKIILKTTTDRERESEYMDVQTNRFYSVEFTLDSSGKIKDKVMIISTSTLDIDPAIIGLMKRTEGNWINHSGHDIDVIFPISFLYHDGLGSENNRRCDLTATSFSNWKKNETVILETLVTTIFPTTR